MRVRGTTHHELVGGRQAGAAAEADATARQPAISRAIAAAIHAPRIRTPLRTINSAIPRLHPLTMHDAVQGASCITVHEMLGSLQFVGPRDKPARPPRLAGRGPVVSCGGVLIARPLHAAISSTHEPALGPWHRADPEPQCGLGGGRHLRAICPLTAPRGCDGRVTTGRPKGKSATLCRDGLGRAAGIAMITTQHS